ncbi:MAG: hypothetical protein DMG63_10115 [Acidobacteria bacterium]|nr:MAG: hypothetical protein DMG63_10115 [Acidobacteriota bacterium]
MPSCGTQKSKRRRDGIKFPAAVNIKARKLGRGPVHLICEDRQTDEISLLDFLCEMKPVLIQSF